MSGKVAGIAAAVVGIGVGGTFLATTLLAPADRLAECIGSTVAGGDIGGPFTLVSETGETVTDKDVITGPTLIYFGYTFCPDVCPMDTDRMALAMEQMDEEGTEIDALFISIDPVRDTPEYLAEYTSYFHDRMIGLSGTEEQVKEAATAYRAFYRKVETEDPEFYLMDHSTLTYLVTPEEGFVTFFRRDMTPEQIAEQVTCVAQNV